MAANRIRGISIEIEGNTTKLNDALKDVDKSLKDTQTQLKDVDKLLKLDPSNIELLRQKHELLGKAVKDTKTRQEELKKALEASKNAGDTEENRKQQDLLQRELAETTLKLGDLEKAYAKSSPTLASISAKTGELSEKTKKLSAAAAVGAAGMIGMAVSAASTADDLLTMSRNTGFSVEELQKLQYAADLIDVSYETMTGSITKLTAQMASGNEAFNTLGVSITNSDGSMRAAKDVWYDAVEALGKVENATERDQLAMELFGKKATEMSGIVDDGGAALKALGEEAEATGTILGEDEVKNAGKFNDALDKLKGTAAQAFTSAGATLATTLVPALEKLINVVSKVLTWFGNLDGTTQTVILTVLGLVAAISPVLGLVSTLTTLAAGLNVAMLPMIGTIALIVAAVAGLVAGGVLLYKNWDTIKAKATELWQKLKETFENIKNKITTVFENIKSAVTTKVETIKTKVTSVFESMKSAVTNKIETLKTKLTNLFENIKSAISNKTESIKSRVTSSFEGVKQGITDKITAAKNTVSNIFENIKTAIEYRINLIKSIVTTVFEGIKSALTNPIETAKNTIVNIIETIKNLFNFSFHWPDIPLPHFSVSPSGWKVGDLLKGKIPRMSISWYAKAMDNGMVLEKPTIFGLQDGKFLGGGEAGREVVVGANSLMSMIRQATAGSGGVSVSVTVNGNVDNYDALAETIGQKLQQQMARQGRAFG